MDAVNRDGRRTKSTPEHWWAVADGIVHMHTWYSLVRWTMAG